MSGIIAIVKGAGGADAAACSCAGPAQPKAATSTAASGATTRAMRVMRLQGERDMDGLLGVVTREDATAAGTGRTPARGLMRRSAVLLLRLFRRRIPAARALREV